MIENFILKILKKIESIDSNVFTYAYKVKQGWYEVSVSEFDFYFKNEHFKRLSKAWRASMNKMGHKIVFVCSGVPSEKKLVSLLNDDNLIMCNECA